MKIQFSFLVAGVVVVVMSNRGLAQSNAALRGAIAGQEGVDVGVWHSPRAWSPKVTLDTLRASCPGVTLFRGRIPDAHPSVPRILGERAGVGPIRLGGFPAIDLEALSQVSPFVTTSIANAEARTRCFITAADPNGAEEILISGDNGMHSLVANRSPSWPPAWPADTALRMDDSTFFVRRSVMSHALWSEYGKPWTLIQYSFLIGSRGELLGWKKEAVEIHRP